ncbi:cyclic nucleotide-binding domain-containing protein [Alphaproteobacteria bacterium]|jgi:CRP-like cAMP-binding protein|nr:cyclic nucleotide-binding domain-containing protein [Alphaproteobacteria bacterium]|tara:strand:- start:7360 stop:7812 length:453 start_codon:yes stop_codon:yes gene_type:complete
MSSGIKDNNFKKNFLTKNLVKNEILFREDDALGDGYIIDYGEITLKRNNKIVETLGEGEVLGIFNLFFDNNNRFFTATANVKTQVYVIPEQYLRDILNKADPFVKHGFRTWFKLTNKFLVALDKSLEKDTKQKKQDEADKESYNKMKSVS